MTGSSLSRFNGYMLRHGHIRIEDDTKITTSRCRCRRYGNARTQKRYEEVNILESYSGFKESRLQAIPKETYDIAASG
jgi:hypothetical protein